MYQYELENGLDREFEWEFENISESEYENEEFLGNLLSKVAPKAINAVGSLLGEGDNEFEFENEREPFLGTIGGLLGEGEYEFESEFELAQASEYETLMEHLGHMAANSESEAEAEAFLGALIPLAAKLLPGIAKAAASKIIPKVAPRLIQGAAKIGRSLYRSPTTRPLLKAMPRIVQGTVGNLARQVAKGQPITQKSAVQTLARQTAQVLGKPRVAANVMKRSRVIHSKKCCQCRRNSRT
ncbi:hypothetical protein [Iningainema tapete]|uniref:Uncharacterized protein n=1 Tax=Iningainema tapete BLCC-T55 TaxID=2748662 RepID=A0A8J7CIA3_9CYAN|nr:hypothetical protein [Iningainema tapete]MBD2778800.1 hypothetical protein [Iningainema tapete BLCC-T55]